MIKQELPKPIPIPRWYQDLSIAQMQKVYELGDIMRADYVERVTGRTQRALGDIGVTSTFVKITSEQIRQLRRLTDLDPVKFLSEIYRIINGRYFMDEKYKKVYDCNERIILSAIAFLTLPETIVELHHRIPMGAAPKFPPKPLPQQKIPSRGRATSPYLEPLFSRSDRPAYKRESYLWRQRCRAIAMPRAILPPWIKQPTNLSGNADSERTDTAGKERLESYHQENTDKKKNYARVTSVETKRTGRIDEHRSRLDKPEESRVPKKDHITLSGYGSKPRGIVEKEAIDRRLESSSMPHSPYKPFSIANKDSSHSIAAVEFPFKSSHDYSQVIATHIDKASYRKPEKDARSITVGIPGEKNPRDKQDYLKRHPRSRRTNKNSQLGERDAYSTAARVSDNKTPENRLDYSKRPHSDKIPWLGAKDTQLVITGMSESADYPIRSYETSGVARVTPDNSDENFFAELNLADDRMKQYPRGREYLSRNWQEWLRVADEEFIKVEKDANTIIRSIRETVKLMGPEISCDACCSCRQTRKINIKYRETKTPRVVIDSVAMDGMENKYTVGSLSMNSPAPSPPSESITDLPEVIASHDKIVKNNIVGGATNETGETKYYISGVSTETDRVPIKIVGNSKLPKPIENVPPCGCAIEKTFNEVPIDATTRNDAIPREKKDTTLCIGKKYRPKSIGACQERRNDGPCERNPFEMKVVDEKSSIGGSRKKNDYPPAKKNMYSLAAFQPCGDEDGMAVCGGPWGAVNIPDAEELARREAEAKLISKSPPCGDKPGRAICGGAPFGTQHPIPKNKPKKDDDDDDEEEEEIDEEVVKERKKREREERRRAAREPKQVQKLKAKRDERCSTVDENIPGTNTTDEPTSAHRVGKTEEYRSKKIVRSDNKKKWYGGHESKYDSEATSANEPRSSENGHSARRKNRKQRSREERRRRDEAEEEKVWRRAQTKRVKNQWNGMKKLANKFIVSPIVLPKDPPRMCKREDRDRVSRRESEDDGGRVPNEERMTEGPFGWRNKSEEALPVEKTLIYLVEPNEPVERIPVRAGGKPCKCRENRNEKKILLYNVSAMIPESNNKRRTKHSRVIEGLIYMTPTPSVRISDEYVPEYELHHSPYEMCDGDRKNYDFKYAERYVGPKNLMIKNSRASESEIVNELPNRIPKRNEDILIPSEATITAETKWKRTFEDNGLVNFYSRCRDNVPRWLGSVEFSKDGRCALSRSLRVKRPVCECKYERKILKREEEKINWSRRQEKLKTMKKQPCNRVAGLSGPMRTETNVVISNLTTSRRAEDEDIDDIDYCVSGVAQDRVMGPAKIIVSGVRMHTPLITPEISKAEISIAKPHRHWSPPMNIQDRSVDLPITKHYRNLSPIDMQPGLVANENVDYDQPRDSERTDWKNKLKDKTGKRVDVLFRSDRDNIGATDRLEKKKSRTVERDKKWAKDRAEGKASKAEKLPTVPATARRPRQFRISRLVDARSRKKSVESPSSREPRASQTADSVRAIFGKKSPVSSTRRQSNEHRTESKKKLPARDSGGSEKSNNVRATKSAGSESSTGTKIELQNKKKEAIGKIDLVKLLQIELETMASEGFLFAKLPACHLMPQLRYWIVYRRGVAFTPEENKRLMDRSIKIWNAMEKSKPKKIRAPATEMSEKAPESLTFDGAEEIKRNVSSKKATFQSQVRKLRVLRARTMWNLMEFGKYPGVSFKKAYFTYQPAKEADGFVSKPWQKE